MKTILLAVDGMAPHKNALDYALNLCDPVRAGLDVLQIIRPSRYASGLSKLKKGIYRARDLMEDAMVTATYAEAGAPELAETLQAKAALQFKRLIPEGIHTAVDYHCVVTGDNPDAVLKRYVDEHRHIILAIYDSLRFGRKSMPAADAQKGIVAGLLGTLSIPLVLVKDLLP